MAESETRRSRTTSRATRARRATGPRAAPPPQPPPKATDPEDGRPVCTVTFCPICAVVTTLGDIRPEFAAHVVSAGREMLLALRSLIDARLQGLDQHPVRLERLTIE